MVQVSLLLPSWNGAGFLRRCIASIASQRANVDLELIVVDNASTDGAREWLRSQEAVLPWLTCLYNPVNELFARACNQAFGRSDAPFVLVTNNDVESEPSAIRTLLDHALEDPGVATASPRFLLPDGSFQHARRRSPISTWPGSQQQPGRCGFLSRPSAEKYVEPLLAR